MTSPRLSEAPRVHEEATCNWFAGTWTEPRRTSRRSRRPSQLEWLGWVNEPSRDAFEALSRYLLAPRYRGPALREGAARWRESTPDKSKAEEAVCSLASVVRAIAGVEDVLFEERGDEVQVWTIMNEHDRNAEDQVYAAEAQLLGANPSFLFNFRILFRHGRAPEYITPATARYAR